MNTVITGENETQPDVADMEDQLDVVMTDLVDLIERHESLETEIESSLENLWGSHNELDDEVEIVRRELAELTSAVKIILEYALDGMNIKDAAEELLDTLR